MAPVVEHDLLLRAALLNGPAAIDAWREWRARTRIDALDRDSQWLLPLLFVNLRAQGVPPDDLTRYGSVYRHNWYKNHVKLRQAQADLGRNGRAGRAAVVGGSAMALCNHPDAIGARPFDVVTVLQPLPEAAAERAVTVRWREADWLVMHPADVLVSICVSREDRWDPLSRLFWMTDAVTLVRRTPDLDWLRVAAIADSLGQRVPVAAALREIDERCATGLFRVALDAFDRPYGGRAS